MIKYDLYIDIAENTIIPHYGGVYNIEAHGISIALTVPIRSSNRKVYMVTFYTMDGYIFRSYV